jgi:pre-mRNA 3'-end-processing factor FIP1
VLSIYAFLSFWVVLQFLTHLSAPVAPIHPVHLTTEYTPLGRDREVVNHTPVKKPQPPSAPFHLQQTGTPGSAARSSTPIQQASGDAITTTVQAIADTSNSDVKPESTKVEDGVDPKTLPSVRALSNAPALNPSAPGMLDGRSIYEVDIASLESKAWRR